MLRLKVNKEGTGFFIYNAANESIIVEDEFPVYPYEFAKNKLLVTGFPTHMYLIIDWSAVKCILDSNTANIHKTFAFPMPQFDETTFPFIFVVGSQHISIINIAILEHKPLAIGMSHFDRPGLRFAFAVGDLSQIQLHLVLTVQDKEGSGKNLIQYSYITLREDAILSLKEKGQFPAFLKSQIRELWDENAKLEEKIKLLKNFRQISEG